MGEYANKTVGKTKKAIGRATGDRDLEGRGRMQEGAGKVQGGVKTAGRKVNRALDKVGAKVSEARRRKASPRPAAARKRY
ncbi:MAG TPA: CsbD family protein [Candidatus Thermoplasmatota archaeon]|nr:CsbD family protein [Candidatus Thermoplasmatota archaeon]